MDTQDLSQAQLEKSSAILAAARAHFAKQGFEATRLSEVARDAGVAVGTIYLRYAGKAELLAGVLGDVEQSFCNAMDTDDIWATPFPERFTKITLAIVDEAAKAPDLAELMALASYAPKTAHQAMLPKIEAHIRDGVARGALREDIDPGLAAQMAHGVMEGAMRALMAPNAPDPEAVVAHVADAYGRWLVNT
ncbi:MAG: TetR/AcrR family transcriptional regulator [Pseudomonadota bacterium]